METVSDCLHLKVNSKKKIIYMLPLLPNGLKGYSGTCEKLIYEKNLKSKISRYGPFKNVNF
jgi:hypothetical protein